MSNQLNCAEQKYLYKSSNIKKWHTRNFKVKPQHFFVFVTKIKKSRSWGWKKKSQMAIKSLKISSRHKLTSLKQISAITVVKIASAQPQVTFSVFVYVMRVRERKVHRAWHRLKIFSLSCCCVKLSFSFLCLWNCCLHCLQRDYIFTLSRPPR